MEQHAERGRDARPSRITRRVRARLQRLVGEFCARSPRVIELALWINTAWWGLTLTFNGGRLVEWQVYWRLGGLGAPLLWGEVSLALALLAAVAVLRRSHTLRRFWLLASVVWYAYAGMFLFLGRWANPSALYPLLFAFLALVAYLERGPRGEA